MLTISTNTLDTVRFTVLTNTPTIIAATSTTQISACRACVCALTVLARDVVTQVIEVQSGTLQCTQHYHTAYPVLSSCEYN
jgi:hypothetical protein